MHLTTAIVLPVLLAATGVSAVGCSARSSVTACADGITHLYDPDDGQICDLLDCGGGRAPPKTTVPCCPSYNGPLTCNNAPSYLPCFQNAAQSTAVMSSMMAKPTTVATSTALAIVSSRTTAQAGSSGGARMSSGASRATATATMKTTTAMILSSSLSTAATQSPAGNATLAQPSLASTATLSQPFMAANDAASGLAYHPLVAVIGAIAWMV